MLISGCNGGLYDDYEGECLCFIHIHTGYLGMVGVKSIVFYQIVHKKTQQQEQNHVYRNIESKNRCDKLLTIREFVREEYRRSCNFSII